MKLRNGPIWTYVPDFDWKCVRDNIGHSPMYDHFIPDADDETLLPQGEKRPTTMSDIVCSVLEIDPDDLLEDVPLTSYGLDSLSAASLSFALRPLLIISQLQLMADVTLAQLKDRVQEAVNDGTLENRD